MPTFENPNLRNVRRPDVSNKQKKDAPVINIKKPDAFNLQEAPELLIKCGGDVSKFCADYLGHDPRTNQYEAAGALLNLERALKQEKELWAEWNEIIKHAAKIRMQFIRCKAIKMAEGFVNVSATTSTSEVMFASKFLADLLAGQTQAAKKTVDVRYNPYMKTGKTVISQEEAEEMQDQLEDPLDELDMEESA